MQKITYESSRFYIFPSAQLVDYFSEIHFTKKISIVKCIHFFDQYYKSVLQKDYIPYTLIKSVYMPISLHPGQKQHFYHILVFNNRQEAKHGLLTLLCQTVKSVIYKSLLQVITTKKASAAFIILHPLSISNLYPSPNPFLIFVPNCGKHTFPNNWKYRDCSALFFKVTSK